MNNLDCTLAILSGHRDARAWNDHAVAIDLLTQLGLDPETAAKNPKPKIDLDETAVALAEAKAKDATVKAHDATVEAEDARARLNAAKKAEEPAHVPEHAVAPTPVPPVPFPAPVPPVPSPASVLPAPVMPAPAMPSSPYGAPNEPVTRTL